MKALLLVLCLGGAGPLDAGVAPQTRVRPSSVDSEVIDNLELLENLDSSADLELLVELSNEK